MRKEQLIAYAKVPEWCFDHFFTTRFFVSRN